MTVGIDKFLVVGGRSTTTVPTQCLLADYSRREDWPPRKLDLPIVDSLNGGTTRRLVPAERIKRLSTRQMGDTNNKSEILWCDPMQNLER